MYKLELIFVMRIKHNFLYRPYLSDQILGKQQQN